jgi:hypothetical protein
MSSLANPRWIAFAVVVLDKLVHRLPETPFSQRNHPIQTLLLNRSYEPLLRVRCSSALGTASVPRVRRIPPAGGVQGAPLPIPVADQDAAVGQRSVVARRHRAAGLDHEHVGPVRGTTDDLHAARRQLNDEDGVVVRHESTPRPHLGREEIRASNRAPMRPQKRLLGANRSASCETCPSLNAAA